MNTTFLLVNLIVLVVAIGGWVLFTHLCEDNHEPWTSIAVFVTAVGSLATVLLFALSFANPLGTPVITDTADFTVEKTPYRTIVKAFNREVTFTDAYTVVNTDRIERARLIAPTNAWGITLDTQTKLVPLFKEAK